MGAPFVHSAGATCKTREHAADQAVQRLSLLLLRDKQLPTRFLSQPRLGVLE